MKRFEYKSNQVSRGNKPLLYIITSLFGISSEKNIYMLDDNIIKYLICLSV